MATRIFSCLNLLAALSFGGTAAAQTLENPTISIADATGSSCTIRSLSSASSEIRSEMRNLRSEADRVVCLSDGAVFTTDMDGEVRVSILAPGRAGVLGITDHFISGSADNGFTWNPSLDLSGRRLGWSEICDVGTALESADGRRLGWSEICDAGTAVESGMGEINGDVDEFFDIWTEIRIGGQEGEVVRAVLDAMVSYTNAPDSMYIDDASSNYTESCSEGLVYGALCNNELISGAQPPEDGLIAVVVITALTGASD